MISLVANMKNVTQVIEKGQDIKESMSQSEEEQEGTSFSISDMKDKVQDVADIIGGKTKD
jgi:hypothetical protein